MWQMTYAALLQWLQWLEVFPASPPYDGPLSAVWIGLYIPPTTPITAQSTLANLTEANYDGYARQEVVWFPEFLSADGTVTKKGQELYFSPTDALVPNTITGVFIASARTGGSLIAAAVAPGSGVVLASPQNALVVTPVLKLPALQVYGGPEFNF